MKHPKVGSQRVTKKKELLSIALAFTLILVQVFPTIAASRVPSRSTNDLSAGKFLVAGRTIGDPRFFETVVLLIEYGMHGAVGVIINQPTGVRLSELFPTMKGLKDTEKNVYDGGPVNRNHPLLLMRSDIQPVESSHIFGDVYVSSSRMALDQMVGRANKKDNFRLYVGYTGWEVGQLDREVLRGDWFVLKADAETIFDKKFSEIWPEFISRSSAQWVRATDYVVLLAYLKRAVGEPTVFLPVPAL